ncbi:MAG: hypothetical protein A2033_00680 [Bacteroidetes bacterium GWA2_31_9]|nr:MAG: hypothetical protein A2033_00680 [Bacteroidetes bacterium GWA2_31_9]
MKVERKTSNLFLLYSIFYLLLFSTTFSKASNNNALLDSANSYYSSAYYEKAINAYDSIIKSGYQSSEIYFNLGNAYFKSNKITSAILNYEKAKLLAPEDEDIQFNLDLANKYITDKIEILPEFFLTQWLNKIISIFSSDTWAYISLISFITVLILVLLFLFSRIMFLKKLTFGLAILFLILSIKSYVFASIQKSDITDCNSALILTPTVNIKSSPDEKGTDIFVLHEGTKLSIEDSLSNWYNIKLKNGNEGWLHKDDIVRIAL